MQYLGRAILDAGDAVLFKGAMAGLALSSLRLEQSVTIPLAWVAGGRIFAEEHANVFVDEPGAVIGPYDHAMITQVSKHNDVSARSFTTTPSA